MLLTGKELSAQGINKVLHCATEIKKNPSTFAQALSGKSLVMIFEKPSFRTRLSFSLAITSMGGTAIESVSTSRKSELAKDLIRVLNGYCDCVMVRTHDDAELHEMAEFAHIPIINGLSALYHPCQILADLLSLQERFGTLQGLTVCYIGDGNNILHSLLIMAPQLGVTIHYCCPKNHEPDALIVQQCQEAYPQMIQSFATPEQAVAGADAVYTDVWTSMGFEQQNEFDFHGFQVNETLMAHAKPEAVFMHCMPMERGKEVSTSLPDAANSIIFLQSENRLHVQKALLLYLVK